jgi:hypothetical protein
MIVMVMLILHTGLTDSTILTFMILFTGIAGIIHLIIMVDGECRCMAGVGDILTMVTVTDMVILIMDGDIRDMVGAIRDMVGEDITLHIMVADIIHQFMQLILTIINMDKEDRREQMLTVTTEALQQICTQNSSGRNKSGGTDVSGLTGSGNSARSTTFKFRTS